MTDMGGSGHTSRTWEVVRYAHAYRSVPRLRPADPATAGHQRPPISDADGRLARRRPFRRRIRPTRRECRLGRPGRGTQRADGHRAAPDAERGPGVPGRGTPAWGVQP